jgi:hypothetical protein
MRRHMRPQTFPTPAIKLPHGVESSFSKPVNAPSSRNGESWSSNSATRSLANFGLITSLAAGRITYEGVGPDPGVFVKRCHFLRQKLV